MKVYWLFFLKTILAAGMLVAGQSVTHFAAAKEYTVAVDFQREMDEQLLRYLKNGQAKALVSHFNSSVNLIIEKEEGHYSKFQSELILDDFFRHKKVEDVKVVQSVAANNGGARYVVYQLKTSQKTYRVFLRMIRVDDEFFISEVRIE